MLRRGDDRCQTGFANGQSPASLNQSSQIDKRVGGGTNTLFLCTRKTLANHIHTCTEMAWPHLRPHNPPKSCRWLTTTYVFLGMLARPSITSSHCRKYSFFRPVLESGTCNQRTPRVLVLSCSCQEEGLFRVGSCEACANFSLVSFALDMRSIF